jgi:hypothetical protein
MGGKIFISYRRGEDAGFAGRLYDRLERTFRQRLFMDVDSIAPGEDFVSILDTRVAECDVLLALIGRSWCAATDAAGHRRLDNPDDFVRIEIASGLAQGKRVIPVLIDDVSMPRADDLPEDLKPLVRRHAVHLSHERFRADAERLTRALKAALAAAEKVRQEEEVRTQASEEEPQRPRAAAEVRGRAEQDQPSRKAEEQRRAEAGAKRKAKEKEAQKTCFVTMGFGEKTDFRSNPQRVLNLNKTFEYIIQPAVEESGLECIRADKIIHSTVIDKPIYEQLLGADLVIADLSTSNDNAIYELGVRHALRPHGTIVMAESNFKFPFDLRHLSMLMYEHLGKEIGYEEVVRVKGELKKRIAIILENPGVDSPVFMFLPFLAETLQSAPSKPEAAVID